MAIKVEYTHGYYRMLNVLAFITYFMWMYIIVWFQETMGRLLGTLGFDLSSFLDSIPLPGHPWPSIVLVPVFIAWLAGLVALAHQLNAVTTGRWIHILSTWLYIRMTLQTPVSLKDASRVMWHFVPNATGKWHPMTELLLLPREQRRARLLANVAEIERRR